MVAWGFALGLVIAYPDLYLWGYRSPASLRPHGLGRLLLCRNDKFAFHLGRLVEDFAAQAVCGCPTGISASSAEAAAVCRSWAARCGTHARDRSFSSWAKPDGSELMCTTSLDLCGGHGRESITWTRERSVRMRPTWKGDSFLVSGLPERRPSWYRFWWYTGWSSNRRYGRALQPRWFGFF
jgi:hypothetical protein